MTTTGINITKSKTVLYEKRDRVAWVTLNRPEQMNALNSEIRRAITEAMTEASNDDDVLVVIVTGAGGRAFCAGNDLKETAQGDAQVGGAWSRQGPTGSQSVYDCPKPVIAAIDGYALAGGMQLSARCDIRIATEKSRFGMPEPLRSLTPINSVDTMEMGFVPLGEAMWIILSGAHITAQRAYEIGFVQALVPDRDALMAEAERRAGLLKLCAPLAVRALKNGVRLHHNPPTPPEGVVLLDHLRKLNQPFQERVAKSEDRLEGPKAFAEKRVPNWKNR